jgi:hypothetical protein
MRKSCAYLMTYLHYRTSTQSEPINNPPPVVISGSIFKQAFDSKMPSKRQDVIPTKPRDHGDETGK